MDTTRVVLVVSTLLVVAGMPAFAADGAGLHAREPVSQMGRKLGRGLVNTTTGWIELPKAMYLTSEGWGPVFGAVLGGFQGLEVSTVRTLAGIYEAATFPVPVPAEYAPVVLPASAFTWEGLSLRSPR